MIGGAEANKSEDLSPTQSRLYDSSPVGPSSANISDIKTGPARENSGGLSQFFAQSQVRTTIPIRAQQDREAERAEEEYIKIVPEDRERGTQNTIDWLRAQKSEYARVRWTPELIADKEAELKDRYQLFWFRELVDSRAQKIVEEQRSLSRKRAADGTFVVSGAKRGRL